MSREPSVFLFLFIRLWRFLWLLKCLMRSSEPQVRSIYLGGGVQVQVSPGRRLSVPSVCCRWTRWSNSWPRCSRWPDYRFLSSLFANFSNFLTSDVLHVFLTFQSGDDFLYVRPQHRTFCRTDLDPGLHGPLRRLFLVSHMSACLNKGVSLLTTFSRKRRREVRFELN